MSGGSDEWDDVVSVNGGGGTGLPMDLECPNEVRRSHGVDENSDGSGGGCSMGCVCPNRAWTGHVGHVQLWWGALSGYLRRGGDGHTAFGS